MKYDYGFLVCPDCSVTIRKNSSGHKYCKPCAAKRRRVRKGVCCGTIINCDNCNKEIIKNSSAHKFCKECSCIFVLKTTKKSVKNTITSLKSHYVANNLKAFRDKEDELNFYVAGLDIPSELVDLKRLQLEIHRELLGRTNE